MALPGNLTPPRGSRDDLRPKSRACGPVGLRNAPAGAVQASSPTEVCGAAGARFPGWPRHSPSSVGVDSISVRGRLRRRRVPGPIWNRPLQGRQYRSPRCSRHSGPAFAPPHGPFKILFSYAVRVCAGGFVLPGSARRAGGISWGRARGGQCARAVPKQDALPRAPQICPPVRPLPGDAAAPRRYNGGRPGIPCVSQRGGYPLYQ